MLTPYSNQAESRTLTSNTVVGELLERIQALPMNQRLDYFESLDSADAMDLRSEYRELLFRDWGEQYLDFDDQGEDWECGKCAASTFDQFFSLYDDVWAEANNWKQLGELCIDCVEANLGRRLTHADFMDAPANYVIADPRLRLLFSPVVDGDYEPEDYDARMLRTLDEVIEKRLKAHPEVSDA